MTWIKTSDKLPTEGEYCWLYVNFDGYRGEFGKFHVLEGCFKLNCTEYRARKLIKCSGWKSDSFSDILVDQVSHWMPYYTPEPPKEES